MPSRNPSLSELCVIIIDFKILETSGRNLLVIFSDVLGTLENYIAGNLSSGSSPSLGGKLGYTSPSPRYVHVAFTGPCVSSFSSMPQLNV